jgi:hypothetical protein
MRLDRIDIRLIQRALESYIGEMEWDIKIYETRDPQVAADAQEEIGNSNIIYDKLSAVVEAIDNLREKGCNADVVLTPSLPA